MEGSPERERGGRGTATSPRWGGASRRKNGVEGKGEAGAEGRGLGKGMPKKGRLPRNFSPGREESVLGRAASGETRGSCVRPQVVLRRGPEGVPGHPELLPGPLFGS